MPRERKIKDIDKIKKMYSDGYSIQDIANVLNVAYASLQRYMKKNNVITRTLKDAKKISKKTCVGLQTWRKHFGSWNKGLTKADERVRINIERSTATQLKNGKNKGANNPMYGKLPKFHSGFRSDLNHFVRSSWEANFCRILNYLNIRYEYEKYCFKLLDGRTYTPDFFIPSKNVFYEIKGYANNDKHLKFKEQYLDKKIIIVNEKYYNKLMRRYGTKILLDSRGDLISAKDVIDNFNDFLATNPNGTITGYCKKNKISRKLILRLFGSTTLFYQNIKSI